MTIKRAQIRGKKGRKGKELEEKKNDVAIIA
jgi:hypothetical protein